MKIRSVRNNNRTKALQVRTSNKDLRFPHSKLEPPPSAADPIRDVSVDRELGGEAVTYILQSGKSGTVHIEQILAYNEDPRYLRDALLYKLTLAAQIRLEKSALSKREIIRRLGTSATQFYRLLDQTNYRKSIDQLLSLLRVLDCDVELIVRSRTESRGKAA